MKLLSTMLLILTVIFPAKAQQKRAPPMTSLNDQLLLTEQFIHDFFPELISRDAILELHVSIGIKLSPTPGEVSFEVIDRCPTTPPPGVPQIGHTVLPCTEYDKTYKRPLWGAISFTNHNGKIIPVTGRFYGELFDGPGPCPRKSPTIREGFAASLRLDRMKAFMGRSVRIVEEDPETEKSRILIQAGPRAAKHSLYGFGLGVCGYVGSFYLLN